MNRFQQREQAFFLLFQNQFKALADEDNISVYSENVEEVGEYAKELYQGVLDNKEAIDAVISSYSNGWKINRLPKVNLSILRLAVYEIRYVDNVPDSVAINEAVELAKKYSSKEDSSFINGVLGTVVRSQAQ